MSVFYEWNVEEIDKYGDIQENNFSDKLSEQYDSDIETALDAKHPNCLVLVRYEGNDCDGVTDQAWAYVKDGKLPECFSNELGHDMPNMRVPQRFQKEFERFMKNLLTG